MRDLTGHVYGMDDLFVDASLVEPGEIIKFSEEVEPNSYTTWKAVVTKQKFDNVYAISRLEAV